MPFYFSQMASIILQWIHIVASTLNSNITKLLILINNHGKLLFFSFIYFSKTAESYPSDNVPFTDTV